MTKYVTATHLQCLKCCHINVSATFDPYMPEKGMIESSELKIHQTSHARYFEDFLKFVEYGESMHEIMKTQVMTMVQEHVYETYEKHCQECQQFEHDLEIWQVRSVKYKND